MPIATDAAATTTITMPIATFIFVLMLEMSPDGKLGSSEGVYGANAKGFGEREVTITRNAKRGTRNERRQARNPKREKASPEL